MISTHWLRRLPLLALLTCLAACGAPASTSLAPAATAVSTAAGPDNMVYVISAGQRITLAPGHTLTLERVNDSRCRTGAVCVWAGYISYSFTLSGADGPSSFVLSDAMPGAASALTRQKLHFALLAVEPAAPPAVNAAPPRYRVTLKVSIT